MTLWIRAGKPPTTVARPSIQAHRRGTGTSTATRHHLQTEVTQLTDLATVPMDADVALDRGDAEAAQDIVDGMLEAVLVPVARFGSAI